MGESLRDHPEEINPVQTFQMLAATAANLSVQQLDMKALESLMDRPCPASCEEQVSTELLDWMLEAEARYRVRLAQKILDVAQVEHK